MSKKSNKPAKPATPQVKPVKRTKACRPAASKVSPVTKVPRKALQPRRVTHRTPQPIPIPDRRDVAVPVAAAPAAVLPSAVTVAAIIDVGFGSTLYIRGQGAGLNWSSGVAMHCEADSRWTITLPTHGPVVFKLLVNDLTWSQGENYEAVPGEAVQVSPSF
jgi:hypothetical protein